MNKKLTAKVQELNDKHCIVIEPENKDLQLKKGKIYAIFDVIADVPLDEGLVSKVVHDVLHDSYFQSDNISPIQSLEKAIVDVRDRVIRLPEGQTLQKSANIKFNILAGVLWGNVLYVVQYGEGVSYLVREGELRPINTMSEGSFSAASGVVHDEDVVIFCTKAFSRKFPPEKLLSISIGEQELQPSEACLLMKLVVDTSFSEDEIVDFGVEKTNKKKGTEKVFGSLTAPTEKIKSILSKIRPKRKTSSITTTTIQPSNVKLRDKKKLEFKFKPAYLIPVVAIVFVFSIYSTIKRKSAEPEVEPMMQENVAGAENVEQEEAKEEESLEGVFYDLKITDQDVQPTEIVVFDKTLVVTDKNTGKIYTSSTDTPKFEALGDTFSGITSAHNKDGELVFVNDKKVTYFDLVEGKVTDDVEIAEGNVAATYLDFIYVIEGNSIVKYTKETGESTVWGESEEFNNAKSMAISYSIYVISDDGNLVAYTSGEKATFDITGLEVDLSNPVQVIASPALDNIYVVDKGNQRVVVLDEDGVFVQEIKAPEGVTWNDLRSATVSLDEEMMYVLNGSRVYEVSY